MSTALNRIQPTLHFAFLLFLCQIHWQCKDAPPPSVTLENAARTEVFPEDCNRISGYFWSTLLKDCFPLFKSGVKLHPIHPDAQQKGKVYLAFNADSSFVEAWMPFERNTSLFVRDKSNKTRRWLYEDQIVECTETCRLISGKKILYEEQGIK